MCVTERYRKEDANQKKQNSHCLLTSLFFYCTDKTSSTHTWRKKKVGDGRGYHLGQY